MALADVDRWLDEGFPRPWNGSEESYETIKEWLHYRASLPWNPAREPVPAPRPAAFAYGDPWRFPYGPTVARLRDGGLCVLCGRPAPDRDTCLPSTWAGRQDSGDPAVLRTLCAECWTSERRRLARELCDAPAVRQTMLWEYRPCTATAPSSRTGGEG